jgi:hypothetical protein
MIRLAFLALLATMAPMTVGATVAAAGRPAPWVGTWAAAQVAPASTGLSHDGFTDRTVRDVVHLSAGGTEIRIRISDIFGRSSDGTR